MQPKDGGSSSSLKSLEDPRRAVIGGFVRQITPEELQQPLPTPKKKKNGSASSCWEGAQRICGSIIAKICGSFGPASTSPPSPVETPNAPRRWYKVHPEKVGNGYSVRSVDLDVDLGHVPGGQQAGEGQKRDISNRRSARARSWRPAFPDDRDDIKEGLCTICYAKPSGVVILPCKHGGICEGCLRRAFFSRAAHKGARTCPFCRAAIKEVVRIDDSKRGRQYGYAIKIDAFSRD